MHQICLVALSLFVGAAPKPASRGSLRFEDGRVSGDAVGVPTREVMRQLLEANGRSFVIGPGFDEGVVARWSRKPVGEALAEVETAARAHRVQVGPNLILESATPFDAPDAESRRLRLVPVTGADIDAIATAVRHLSAVPDSVLSDSRTQTLIVKGTRQELSRIESFVRTFGVTRAPDGGLVHVCECELDGGGRLPSVPPPPTSDELLDLRSAMGDASFPTEEVATPWRWGQAWVEADGGWAPRWPNSIVSAISDGSSEEALAAVADTAGLGIAPMAIGGRVSMRLRDVPADLAVAALAELTHFPIWIGGRRRGDAGAEVMSGDGVVHQEGPEVRIRLLEVKTRPAQELAPLARPMLSRLGWLEVEPKTNTLVLYDVSPAETRIEGLVRTLDLTGPPRRCWCPGPVPERQDDSASGGVAH